MDDTAANLQPRRRSKRWLVWLGLLAALAVGIWGFLKLPRLSQLVPPPVHSFVGEDRLDYELRRDRYVQTSEDRAGSVQGDTYSLAVELDNTVISPAINSNVKATVTLLKNGRPAGSMPEALYSKTMPEEDPSSRLYVKSYGVYGMACTDSSLVWNRCVTGTKYLPILPVHATETTSAIYSPQAKQLLDDRGRSVAQFIDLANGQAELELVYRGGRYAPYLELEFFTDLDQVVYARRILPFADQLTGIIPQPQLATSVGDIKYDVTFSPNQLKPGEPTRVRIDVIAKQAADGSITNQPYQRVRIWAYPLSLQPVYSNDANKWDRYITRTVLEKAGDFLGELTSGLGVDDEITTTNQQQSVYVYPDRSHIEADLIDGKATVYFDFNGKARINRELAFVVEPANYDYEATIRQLGLVSDRELVPRYRDELPPRPDQADPFSIRSDYSFLYGDQWYSGTNRPLIYTITPLAIDLPAGTSWSFSAKLTMWIWAATSQLAQLILGGLMIWYYRRRKAAKPIADRPKSKIKPWQVGFVWLVAFGWLTYGLVVSYRQSTASKYLAPPPEEQLLGELERPPETMIKPDQKTGYRFEIVVDNNRINPYPGAVTNGRVRLVDADGNLVKLNGGLVLRVTDPNQFFDSAVESKFELHGQESFTRGITAGEYRTDRQIDPDLEDISDLADSFGVGGQFRELLGEDLYVDQLVQVSSDLYSFQPGCAPDELGFAAGCQRWMLVLHSGEASFRYVNIQRAKRYVTFDAEALIVPEAEGRIYHWTDIETYDPKTDVSAARPNSTGYSVIPKFYAFDQLVARTSQSFAFDGYGVATPPRPTPKINSKTDRYYQIASQPKIAELQPGARFKLTLTPTPLPGRSLANDYTDKITLNVLPGYDPWSRIGLFGSKEAITYPAEFVTEGGSLSSSIEFEIGNNPVTLELEYTGEPSLKPNIDFELKALGLTGYPADLKFGLDNELSLPSMIGNKTILAETNPTVVEQSFSIPIRQRTTSYLLPLMAGLLLTQILLGALMVWIYKRRKTAR